MRALARATCVVAALSAASVARADEKPREHWYGWQTLTSDAASTALILSPLVLDNSAPTVVAGVVSFVLVPPVIHLAHGQSESSSRSFAGRVLLPLGGAVVFAGVAYAILDGDCSNPRDDERLECEHMHSRFSLFVGGIGAVGGMIAASWMDASWLARESTTRTTSVGLLPNVGRDRVGMAIGGVF